jgi:phosphoribosylaminoimidazolecarboxamide formyltransferase/IMP cyclohydrolase
MAASEEDRPTEPVAAQKRALISVYDKSGIIEFASDLCGFGFEIISTGGSARLLSKANIPVTDITDVTGHPEVFDGRVKTLHPAVHAGILARNDRPDDLSTLADLGYDRIDIVCVDLYPFEAAAAKWPPAPESELIEMIDIGGPTLLRAAAKAHRDVLVVPSANHRGELIDALAEVDGNPRLLRIELRRRFAIAAYQRTAAYDVHVATTLSQRLLDFPLLENDENNSQPPAISTNHDISDTSQTARNASGDSAGPPPQLLIAGGKMTRLRYGENPHQLAAFYPNSDNSAIVEGLATAEQHGGKELSFNNYLDLDAALRFVRSLTGDSWSDWPHACVVIKHTNACGVAISSAQSTAWQDALASDPESAFGCVIAFNSEVTAATADSISDHFVECIIAPSFHREAFNTLSQKKNRRLLTLPNFSPLTSELRWRQIDGGWLAQSEGAPLIEWSSVQCVTKKSSDEAERELARFGVAVCAQVKSNCVVFVKSTETGLATVGIGPGQTSRVEAVRIAARRAGRDAAGAMMVSDAFFPFRDGIDAADEMGITSVVQPGGSIRDSEVITAADEHGMTMLFTGTRLFRH